LYEYDSVCVELEEHLIEVHNSRRPLSRRTLTLTLTLTFDLIFIGGQCIVVDYLCALVSAVLVLSFRQTGRQTESQTES